MTERSIAFITLLNLSITSCSNLIINAFLLFLSHSNKMVVAQGNSTTVMTFLETFTAFDAKISNFEAT